MSEFCFYELPTNVKNAIIVALENDGSGGDDILVAHKDLRRCVVDSGSAGYNDIAPKS